MIVPAGKEVVIGKKRYKEGQSIPDRFVSDFLALDLDHSEPAVQSEKTKRVYKKRNTEVEP